MAKAKSKIIPVGSTVTGVRTHWLDDPEKIEAKRKAKQAHIVVEKPVDLHPESDDKAAVAADPLPSGYYKAAFVAAEAVPHQLYKQAKRFDFRILDGEFAGRIVSCTIDTAAQNPIYRPRYLCMSLAGVEKPENVDQRYTVYVMQTPTGTNRIDTISKSH